MRFMKTNKGFTLAEVLITLGIIGVVAAMTIPSLINKYQKLVFINRIKTTNVILSEAMTMAVADYGDVSEWDFGNQVNTHDASIVASKYFVPYLKKIKQAGYCKKNLTTGTVDKTSYCLTLVNGVNIRFMLDGTFNEVQSSLYLICSLKNDNGVLSLSDAGRNYSRTDFLFKINKNSTKKNYFGYFDWGTEHPIYSCSKNILPEKRLLCTAKIVKDGWQIKDDFPW